MSSRLNRTAFKQKSAVAFYTLGCRVNQAETAVLTTQFEKHGYTIIPPFQSAPMAIINTCTVTQHADKETNKLIRKILRTAPATQIALIGCQAQTQGERLSEYPQVKWIVGNQDKMGLLEILEQTPFPTRQSIRVNDISRKIFTHPVAGIEKNRARANLKIQDGCDTFCAYCEVPFARGPARSRDFKDILREARALALHGHREIVLTGINLGRYRFQDKDLLDVIDGVEKIKEIDRIRISSIEPTNILSRLIARMKKGGKLCRYLHVPIQSACDKTLKRMGRKYTFNKILTVLKRARQTIPDICLGADIIVGFPGETDEDFETTFNQVMGSPINYIHVFSYSDRPNAASKNLPEKVPPQKIAARSERLRKCSQQRRNEFYSAQRGKIYSVLFEQKKQKSWTGLTDNFIHVKLTKLTSKLNLSRQMLQVKLLKAQGDWMESDLT